MVSRDKRRQVVDRITLERALNENVPDISGKNIWIWGAGNTARLYQEGLRRLGREELFVQGYIDNDPDKIGKQFNGKPVISSEELKKIENVCVLLCSIRSEVLEEVGAQCDELQLEWYLLDEVILKFHCEDVMKCYDMLYDEQSKDIYADLILWRIRGKKTDVMVERGNTYFALDPFTQSRANEVFVDCGAWSGDVEEQYIEKKHGVFKKIIAFEPDPINYNELVQTIKKLQKEWKLSESAFELCPCGVGEKSGVAYFERYETNNGQGSKFYMINSENVEQNNIVSLDEFLKEDYSFLKADIESFEYQMLMGAEKGIKRNKPLLTICIYHNAVDLYSIPLLVKTMVPEYKIAVRHHLDTLAETVLYAWIDD